MLPICYTILTRRPRFIEIRWFHSRDVLDAEEERSRLLLDPIVHGDVADENLESHDQQLGLSELLQKIGGRSSISATGEKGLTEHVNWRISLELEETFCTGYEETMFPRLWQAVELVRMDVRNEHRVRWDIRDTLKN